MSDPRIEKWARTLVTYSVAVKPSQTVAISAGVAAEPLIRAIYREVVKAGGCPIVLPTFRRRSGSSASPLRLTS